jgi:quinol monooxygenase YgiN
MKLEIRALSLTYCSFNISGILKLLKRNGGKSLIIIHAHIKVKPEYRQDFLDNINELVEKSQAEEGNVSYQLYEDTQHDNQFVMLEEWKNAEAVQYHFETPHFKDFGKMSRDFLQGPLHVVKYEATAMQ